MFFIYDFLLRVVIVNIFSGGGECVVRRMENGVMVVEINRLGFIRGRLGFLMSEKFFKDAGDVYF